jgi:transcriptional regulator
MHPNAAFRTKLPPEAEHQLLAAWVRKIGFGTIFLTTPDGPRVAHAPFVCAGDTLQFHLAQGNALTKHIAGSAALAVVHGPDAYVSPDYYAGANQVPTWNYVAIEMEGRVRMLDDDGLIAQLDNLSALHEERLLPKKPWTRDKMDEDIFRKMLGAIVGFEMKITAWRPTFKLSQNKPTDERTRVADALDERGEPRMAQLIRGLPLS